MLRKTQCNLITCLIVVLSAQWYAVSPAVAQDAVWSHAIDGLEHMEAISSGHFLLLNGKDAYRILNVKTGELWMGADKSKNEIPVYPRTKPETIIVKDDDQYELFDLAEKKSLGAGSVFSQFDCYPLSSDQFLFQFYNISDLTGQRQNLNIVSVNRGNAKSRWSLMSYELGLLNAVLSEDKSKTFLLTEEGIEAINNADGSKLWEAKIPTALKKPAPHGGEVLEHEGAVYVTQEGLTKIDAATGEVAWSEKYAVLNPAGGRSTGILAGTAASPLFTADAVYTAGKGKIRKFDISSGKKLWESKDYKAVPTMKLDGDRLVFVTGGVFQAVSGPGVSGVQDSWNALPDMTANGSLNNLNNGVVAVGKPGFGALNATSGELEFLAEGNKQSAGLYEHDGGWILADAKTLQRVGSNGAAETLLDVKNLGIGDGLALMPQGTDWVLCGKDGIVKINLQSSTPAWTCNLKKFKPLGVTEKSVIGVADKEFTVVDAASGSVAWQIKLPNEQWSVSVEGQFLAIHQKGQVALYAFE